MSTSITATPVETIAVDVTPGTGIIGAMTRLAAAVRSAAEARRLRTELGSLDASVLRDIGVHEDEIARVHACEDFVPRSWRD